MARPTFPWRLPPGGYDGHQAVGDLVRYRAEHSGDSRLFVLQDEAPLSATDVYQGSLSVASLLIRNGFGTGERVTVMLPNCAANLLVQYGISLAGLIEVPIHNEYRGPWLEHVLNVTEPKALVIHADLAERLSFFKSDDAAWPESIEAIWVVGEEDDEPAWSLDDLPTRAAFLDDVLAESDGSAPTLPRVEETDPAYILFTSGTTGRSKGALLSHRAALSLANEVVETVGYTESDAMYTAFPLFHASAKFTAAMVSLVSGAKSVIHPKFTASGVWDICRAENVTGFTYVGAMLAQIWKQPPRDDDTDNPVRRAWGAPAPVEFAADFEKRFDIELIEVYGSTEVGPAMHMRFEEEKTFGTCGREVSHYEVELHDDDGLPVPVGVEGEIVVRPKIPSVLFDRYWGMPDETVAAWQNLWFHTGDIGRKDDKGNFTYVDRKKDTIRRRGENVSSFELERILMKHDAVQMAAAYGVPSELGEDDIMVAVLLAPDLALDPDELIEYCEPLVPRFAVPRYVRFVEDLPMTPSGRVQKYRLREEALTPDAWDREAE